MRNIFVSFVILAISMVCAMGQNGQVIRVPSTTNQFMNSPQDGWIMIWNNVAKRWSNGVNTASATNDSQPPSTVLSNLTATGVSPGATNASAYIASLSGLGSNVNIKALVGTSRALTVNTNVLVVTNGNVGIGTDAPSTKLHVVGDSTFSGDVLATGPGNFIDSGFAGEFVLITGIGPSAPIQESSITETELNTLDGITGNIEGLLGNKIANLNGLGTNTQIRTRFTVNGILESTNGKIVLGDINAPSVMTNYNSLHQRSQLVLNDPGNSVDIRNGAFLEINSGGAIILGADDGAETGTERIQFEDGNYITSPTGGSGDVNEIFRYRFWGDTDASASSNRVQRWWEVSNYVASVSVGGNSLSISNFSVIPSGPILPLQGNMYSFGDSQTEGWNNNLSLGDGTLIAPRYRWVSLVATQGLRGLSISNWGIGGAQMASASNTFLSIWGSSGRLPAGWEGLATFMGGWNDYVNYPSTEAFWATLQRSYEAMLARLLIDDWGGYTAYGWTRAVQANVTFPGTPDTVGFSFGSGVDEGTQEQLTTSSRNAIPFFFTGALARYWMALQTNNYVHYNATNKRSAVFFFDTYVTGGVFSVIVDGVERGRYTTDTDDPPGAGQINTGTRWPMAVWVEGLNPSGTSIRLQLTNNTPDQRVYFNALGWVNSSADVMRRTVVMNTMTANTNSLRVFTNLFKGAKAAESAVSAFAPYYPVYLGDTFSKYSHSYAELPADPAHFNVAGNQFIAQAVMSAYRPSSVKGSNTVLYLDSLGDVLVLGGTGGVTVTPSVSGSTRIFTVNDDDAGEGSGGAGIGSFPVNTTQLDTNGVLSIIAGFKGTNANLVGTTSLTNPPGATAVLRFWQTNGLGYTELTVPPNWLPTNRVVMWQTNASAGKVWKVNSVSISGGVATVNMTNDFVSGTELVDDSIAVAKFSDGDWGDASISGNVLSIDANSVALGTDTTGNYVGDVAGTANEVAVSHTPAEGSTATISLPATIDLGGKTSFELPNGASPTVDAVGEIAVDNNLWAASRGAPIWFDGTAAVAGIGALVSDTPSNGQVPKWNTGGTITWEDDTGGSATTNNPVQAVGTLILTNGTIYKPLDLGSSTNMTVSFNTNYYIYSPSNNFAIALADIPPSTDGRRIYLKLINTNATSGVFPTNGLNGGGVILLSSPSTNEFTINHDTNGIWIGSGQILTTGTGDTNMFNVQPVVHSPTLKGTNFVAGNLGFVEQYPTGTGGANTNFTLLVNEAASFVINGFTNISFRALYGGTLGITYTFSIEATNGSGANRTLEFSPITNNWVWSYSQGAAPTVLTNSERVVIEGKLRGTNITATYAYFPWP